MSENSTETTSTGRKTYAVYNTDHLRFVGQVFTNKKDAEKFAKDANVSNYEIREV